MSSIFFILGMFAGMFVWFYTELNRYYWENPDSFQYKDSISAALESEILSGRRREMPTLMSYKQRIRGRGGISVKNTRLGDNIIFSRNWKIPKLHTNNL